MISHIFKSNKENYLLPKKTFLKGKLPPPQKTFLKDGFTNFEKIKIFFKNLISLNFEGLPSKLGEIIQHIWHKKGMAKKEGR